MTTDYYNKFAVGLIDGLLIQTDEDYSMYDTIEGETKNQTKKVRIRDGSILKRNAWIGEKNGHVMKTPEMSVHEWICKQNMIPVIDDIDYEYEYPSPFSDAVTKSLLMLRWVTGLQAMNNQDAVDITKEDLKEIGLDHTSVMDWKMVFDKMFRPSISQYHEGAWTVKIGGRDAVPGNGPGTIKIKVTQFTGLYNMILDHHKKVMELPKVEKV